MQKGMLFHSELEPSAYVTHLSIDLPRDIDLPRFKQAWQTLIDRHDIYRTAFVGKHLDQLVVDKVTLPWQTITEMGTETSTEQDFNHFCQQDKQQGFDPSQPNLMRLIYFKPINRLLWSSHHALTDGWSIAAALNEVINLYQGKPSLAPAPSYRQFIQYLHHQDNASAKHYWQNALKDISEFCQITAAPLAKRNSKSKSKRKRKNNNQAPLILPSAISKSTQPN